MKAQNPPLILLRHADLYAPDPRGLVQILIGAGRILWIGEHTPQLDRALNIAQLDLHGARVIPGLIDCHAHITGGGGEAGAHSKAPPLMLHRFTGAGVTTVVGLLGTDDLTRSTAELLTRIHGLREQGLSAYGFTGGYHFPATTLTGSIRGDIVYLQPIIGVGELAISDHRSSQPTLDELLRVASEAHIAGLMSGKAGVCHLHLGDGVRGLAMVRQALEGTEIPARVFHPTHVNRRTALFDEACALAQRGCSIDVTAFPVAAEEDALSAADAVLRYRQQGLPAGRLTVSSDGGGCLPVFDANGDVVSLDFAQPRALHETLVELLQRDCPLQHALAPFTSNVAATLKFPTKGQLVAGADADLVVLDDDHQIRHVMARGAWHVRDHQAVKLDRFASMESIPNAITR